MDNWQALQNWLLFVPIVGGLAWYYIPRGQAPTPPRSRELDTGLGATARRKNDEREIKSKPEKKPPVPQPVQKSAAAASSTAHGASENAKKRQATKKQGPQQASAIQSQEQNEPDEELDMSTRQFAQQMQKARQGQQLSGAKSSEKRVKTVKQGSAMDRPALSNGSLHAAVEAEEETSPVTTSSNAGDVSDMLEPVASGPKSLRVTAPSQPPREKGSRQPKKDEIETKKQRQNRLKVEERKLQREAEEKERKALEEKQRRAAREARGEPSKNGIPVSKAPANNAWDEKPALQEDTAPTVDSNHAPLLDTFDAESSSSSNGGHGASTGPSSVDHDAPSEEEQLALAMQQSVDESGWTTVVVPKKQKKKAVDAETSGDHTTNATPAFTSTPKTTPAVTKSSVKPTGFQALEDQYTQRTDVDPNDASNWDA